MAATPDWRGGCAVFGDRAVVSGGIVVFPGSKAGGATNGFVVLSQYIQTSPRREATIGCSSCDIKHEIITILS
jgi:hypothetical protein